MQYDSYKVQAVLNEIDGFDHSGTTRLGTPAIFGMNFQPSRPQRSCPTSNGLTGGYLADGATPGPAAVRSARLRRTPRSARWSPRSSTAASLGSTAIMLSAKHGQSPQEPSALTRIDGRPDHRLHSTPPGRRPTRRRRPRRVRDRRRRDADVAERPLAGRDRVREVVPARPLRGRQRHQRQPEGVHELGARTGLRRRRCGGVLRCADQ